MQGLSMSQILENLISVYSGRSISPNSTLKEGRLVMGVEPEFPADGLNRLNEKSRHFTTARQECFRKSPGRADR